MTVIPSESGSLLFVSKPGLGSMVSTNKFPCRRSGKEWISYVDDRDRVERNGGNKGMAAWRRSRRVRLNRHGSQCNV